MPPQKDRSLSVASKKASSAFPVVHAGREDGIAARRLATELRRYPGAGLLDPRRQSDHNGHHVWPTGGA